MSLGEIGSAFGVSDSTVRRDLEVLEELGTIRRTHGGAVSLAEPAALRLGFADREGTAVAEKQAIAARVAGRIPDEQTLILDGGTTCCQVARALAGRRISIITNSVPVAVLLGGELATEVTLIGGYLYPRTGVALGPMAEEMLSSLRAAQAVLSCAAVGPDGLYNVNEMMTGVERRMIAAADEVIVAADHTKFGKRAVAKLCGWSEVDVLVTDRGIGPDDRAWVEQAGVQLILAEASEAGRAAGGQ